MKLLTPTDNLATSTKFNAVLEGSPVLTAVRLRPEVFDESQGQFDGITQEMTMAFAAARWPRVKLEPWLYAVDGKPRAAVIVMVQKLPLGMGYMAIVKWGPALADERDHQRSVIYELCIRHLLNEYCNNRKMMLSVMPKAETLPKLGALDVLEGLGFKNGSSLSFPNRYIVSLRLSDAEQRKSFSQKWRYHLNKSEKEKLEFVIAPVTDLERFDTLYQSMSDRKNFPDHSAYGTLDALFKNLPETLKPRLFFVRKDGVDVAGAVIFAAGRTAVYLYGATNDQALPLRAGYFMHARIISWLRDHTSADWYDLGGTDGFLGLHQFKSGMVGTAGLISPVPYIANFAPSWRGALAGNTAYLLRDAVQVIRHQMNKLTRRQAVPDLPKKRHR